MISLGLQKRNISVLPLVGVVIGCVSLSDLKSSKYELSFIGVGSSVNDGTVKGNWILSVQDTNNTTLKTLFTAHRSCHIRIG